MSLKELSISADAYLVCLTHVLSTESTEVMGVLLGDVDDDRVCRVLSAKALVRLDKRKDRVEISSSQLMSAATEAERLAAELDRTVHVVGWYHSHPHITVWPSVVDIDTQKSYQLLDRGFAGLIFAVFPDAQSPGVQAACFQSVLDDTGALKRKDVPVKIEPTRTIAPHCLQALAGLPAALREEELASYDAVQLASASDQLTEMHNQAVLVSNITQQLGVVTMPLLQLLENRLQRNQRQLRRLLAERDLLIERLGGDSIKRESEDALSDSRINTVRRPSGGNGRSSSQRLGGDSIKREPEDAVFGNRTSTVRRLSGGNNRSPPQRLGGNPVKREPEDSLSDSSTSAARRPFGGNDRSSPQVRQADPGSSEETVFSVSAAEREPGVSRSRRRLVLDSDSDSTASTGPDGRRRHPVLKEREPDRDSPVPRPER